MIPVEYPSILHAIPASSLISKTSHRKSRKYMKFNIILLISLFSLNREILKNYLNSRTSKVVDHIKINRQKYF